MGIFSNMVLKFPNVGCEGNKVMLPTSFLGQGMLPASDEWIDE
jgi:hypothetical protein